MEVNQSGKDKNSKDAPIEVDDNSGAENQGEEQVLSHMQPPTPPLNADYDETYSPPANESEGEDEKVEPAVQEEPTDGMYVFAWQKSGEHFRSN